MKRGGASRPAMSGVGEPGGEAAPRGSDAWPVHRAFGLGIRSDYPFEHHLAPAAENAGAALSFTISDDPPSEWSEQEPVYRSPRRLEGDGESLIQLYRCPGYDVLHFAGTADFYLWPEHIEVDPLDGDRAYTIEILLLGIVLAYWMERRGHPVLHASAVSLDERAVAFLAGNRSGKSALAASFMDAGHALLTDDLLPLRHDDGRLLGGPGYPQMRMWPDMAEHFLGSAGGLERVYPHLEKRRVPVGTAGLGSFCDRALPLACIYLPERRAAGGASGREIEIRALPPGEAVIELVRRSYLSRMVHAAGFQAERLEVFASLARRVPVRRLRYPEGPGDLPRVGEAIRADLRSSVSPAGR